MKSEWLRWRPVLRALCVMMAFVGSTTNANAHSASDAYLTLDLSPQADTAAHGQWDIALRDLDFVLKLDDDGNGDITWAELQRHQPAIERYAQAHLVILGDGKACTTTFGKQMVANHADGAYAALFFDVRCPEAKRVLTLDYRLFFKIDPSHRAIVVVHAGEDTTTALLSPEKARIELKLTR